ncbi:ABC transporter permease [Dawidia soli]|uniref:ABC transporter permease n=1 Tax=Dawidia soli TaxID=2782352 RepID=A0AAP2GJA7_9BACT|nr:ABC transporter permease [Dawidia soli]MBT1687788.1 ABC transporter permease [Dawidia soli]
MIKNYCIIAWRNLRKFGVYSVINLAGLSVGIAVSLMILLYVSHEVMYDRFHVHGPQIYKANGALNWGGQQVNIMALSVQFAPITKENNPSIKNYVRVRERGKRVVETDAGHRFYESRFVFSDSAFFSMFSFPLLQGEYRALGRPHTVILTEAMAHKYFGAEDPVGKTLLYDRSVPLEVVGVARDFPSNSSLQYDFIASISTLASIPDEKEGYDYPKAALGSCATYFRIDDPTARAGIEQSMMHAADMKSVDGQLQLVPLVSVHFNLSDMAGTRYLGLFISIAVIILALALINYVSLTTARAGIRAREVGIRKVTGARRSSLILQFYIESAMLTTLAFGVALMMIQLGMPQLVQWLHMHVDAGFIWTPAFVGVMVALLVTCIVLAGSYPALLLTRFSPAAVLKGRFGMAASGQWVRKGLTVLQFVASVALIVGSLVVQSQLEFMQTKKIGLNKEQVMVVSLDPAAKGSPHALIQEIRDQAGVLQVASSSLPLYKYGTGGYFIKTPKHDEELFVNAAPVDPGFFKTLDIEWYYQSADSLAGAPAEYVINETALHDLGLTAEDIGKPLHLVEENSVIKAVIKDFNFSSLHQAVRPMMYSIRADTSKSLAEGVIYIRLDPAAQLRDKIVALEAIFHKHQPQSPFDYYFLEDAFNQLYQSEDRLANIFSGFTAVGLVIACLGLFGLVTFYTEVRTKEVGIRKVLGAGLRSVLVLLSKDFVYLVLVSVLVASPLAYWLMQTWLSSFAYRTTIALWFFAAAALGVLTVACLTVGIQAWRAARSNPAEALRSE